MFGQVSEEAATVGIDNGGGRAAVEEVVVSGREAAEVGGDEGQVQKEDGEEEGEVWERNRHGKRFCAFNAEDGHDGLVVARAYKQW